MNRAANSAPYSASSEFYEALSGAPRLQQLRLVRDMLFRILELGRTPRVLDLGCGTGELFKAWGTESICSTSLGVDLSPDMVTRARSDLPTLSFDIGDIRTFNALDQFDIITCIGNPLNYLAPRELSTFFASLKQSLHSNGIAYFDFDTRLDIEQFWDGQTEHIKGESFQVERVFSYDRERDLGVERQHWQLGTEGETKEHFEEHHLYPIEPDKIIKLCWENKLSGPSFRDVETMESISNPDEYLVLGCTVRHAS